MEKSKKCKVERLPSKLRQLVMFGKEKVDHRGCWLAGVADIFIISFFFLFLKDFTLHKCVEPPEMSRLLSSFSE